MIRHLSNLNPEKGSFEAKRMRNSSIAAIAAAVIAVAVSAADVN